MCYFFCKKHNSFNNLIFPYQPGCLVFSTFLATMCFHFILDLLPILSSHCHGVCRLFWSLGYHSTTVSTLRSHPSLHSQITSLQIYSCNNIPSMGLFIAFCVATSRCYSFFVKANISLLFSITDKTVVFTLLLLIYLDKVLVLL